MITTRYSRDNNPYLPDVYDHTFPHVYNLYLDANNLYGHAMSQVLPQQDFMWLSKEEIDNIDISTVPDEGVVGYILVVDLHYHQALHDTDSDYPLAPENLHVTLDMLSPLSLDLVKTMNLSVGKV